MSTKLERIIWIDKQIRAGNYPNAHRVTAHFELRNVRTAYEDCRFMKTRLGAPIKRDNSKGGWYYTDVTYVLPAIILTKQEVFAFFMGEQLVKRYLGTPFEHPLRLALSKIEQYLPEHLSYDAQAERSTFAFTGGATVGVDPALLMELHQAILSKRQLSIHYYSPNSGETTTRVIDPYHLHNIRGDWYLIAYCHKRNAPRDFLPSRIKSRKRLPSTFKIAPTFSLSEYLAQGFLAERGEEPVDIVIKFSEYQARWIRERQWHQSQQIEELPSGELILRLKVGGEQEVKRWVMGYGPDAEILEPQSLRDQIKAEVEKMQKIYGKK